ncbi:MAG: chemotaxis-specific protein-glutamate methyltransferase CheB [Candidatus Odinarchaeota archaeon]
MKNVRRIMIVDDSAVFRKYLTSIINSSRKNMMVIASAPNGKICLTKMAIPAYKPDVVILDIFMPEMDGIETFNHIMDRFPTPVIFISSMKQKEVSKLFSSAGMAAFETGTVEFVSKPDKADKEGGKKFEREIIEKIINLSPVNLQKVAEGFDIAKFMREETPRSSLRTRAASGTIYVPPREKLIIIGASTGGTRAISLILSKFPLKSPPVIIIQHIPDMMVEHWAERLQNLYASLDINVATNGESLLPSKIYIAPGGKHLVVERGKSISLVEGERVNFVIPSIDVTMISAAKAYRQHVLGIILTGMGKDGTDGARKIKNYGGKIFAEHESTCMVSSMPKSVIEENLADRIIPLHEIPGAIFTSGWI